MKQEKMLKDYLTHEEKIRLEKLQLLIEKNENNKSYKLEVIEMLEKACQRAKENLQED